MELITMTDMYGDDRAYKSMYSGGARFKRRDATRSCGAMFTGIEMPA